VIWPFLAALTLLLWLVLSADWFWGMRRLAQLSLDAPRLGHHPTLSVVIPALNEERAIEKSLRSVLEGDYPGLEVIVLNDRSTDRTGEILEAMKARYPGLQVVHIERLPGGWLGKNHALMVGARRARGEWLLFTDADVQFEPGALRAAVAYAQGHGLDHLAAIPQLVAKGPFLKAFVSAFSLLFTFYTRLWRASDPTSRRYAGFGAFNLLRRSVYESVGGHASIALRPDDDMMLGKLVKRADFKQGVVFATRTVRVEWYTGVREAVRGLNKNAFAGLHYSLPFALFGCAALALTHVLPFIAVFLTSGLAQLLYGLVLVNVALVYLYNARFSGLSPLYAALHPVGMAILIYATLASALTVTRRGGITWRGTFYPLAQLKRNRV